MLGALIQGGLGLYGMYKANKGMSNVANSGMNQAYQSMQSGLGDAARMQQNNDQYVSTQMHENEQDSRQIRMGQAGAQMGIAGNMMGGAKGMGALGGQLSTGLGTMLRGKQGSPMGKGGLLGWGAGLFG